MTGRAIACAALAIALALACGVPLGCGESVPAPLLAEHPLDPKPRRGGVLHIASYQDIRSLDPAIAGDGLALQAVHLIFAGLVDLDGGGQVVGELAEKWETADEGLAYRFFLRRGVMMQDGLELEAQDIKRSVERALDPETPNPSASYFENLLGYRAFAGRLAAHIDGVAVEGRYAIVFRLQRTDASFLSLLTMHTLRPVCRTAGTRFDDTWVPCGAGPFKLPAGGWQRGTSLRLVRHDGYFRAGLPYLDAVEWIFNAPSLAQRFRFEAGDLDIVTDLSESDLSRYMADPRWKPFVSTDGDIRVYGEAMNTRVPPFDNVEVRRAVAAAIDREHYRQMRPANMTVLTQPLPLGAAGGDSMGPHQPHDAQAALEHMRKAGYPYDPVTGKGGWPSPIVYALYDRGLFLSTAQLLQQDLAKIGLRIELRLYSFQAFLTLQSRPGATAISPGSWEMDYPDPSSIMDPLFSTVAMPPAGSNWSFYSNPLFDDLVTRARGEMDGARRTQLYREASAILVDDAPWAFTFSYHWLRLRQPVVRGYWPHPLWSLDVERTWLDRASTSLEHVLGTPFR